MHLAQHHFQAQSRYFERAMHFAVSSVFPGSHGFLALELDEDAIWDGTVALVEARGVMPDGLVFHLGEADPLPPERDLSHLLGKGSGAHVVHLAIPSYDARRANCAPPESDDGAPARFRPQDVALFDETTGQDERPVRVGLKNVRLVTADERTEELVGLPVARVRADGSGHLTYDPDFIAPSLTVRASDRLVFLLERLVRMLEAKADAMRARQPGRGATHAEMSSHELTTFWLTHAVYQGLGPLRHHLEAGMSHPREVYEELARLAGALCTFSLEADPASIPPYAHDAPEEGFTALDRMIQELLEIVLPESCISVPLFITDGPALQDRYGKAVKEEVMQLLDRYDTNLHIADLTDERALSPEAEWVLAVRSSAATDEILRSVDGNVKVASAVDGLRFVATANPALDLEHLPTPPSEVSPRVGSHYFRVRLDGPAWKLVRTRGSVGVYVPDALPDAEVELHVIPG